ncbi:MAG: hypothetical protein KG029_00815 [Bacteroidetes bacterium]|nr:hypothetical protein [Bacteroidota bacterium]
MIDRAEVFSWLNEYKAKIYSHNQMMHKAHIEDKSSEMSLAADALKIQMIALISSGRSMYAKQVLDRLAAYGSQSISPLERGEVWVACGMAFYDMNNLHEAAVALKHAVSDYPPLSHQRAVSRWLLGMAQWELVTEADQAIMNWSKTIEDFEALMEQAENDNHRKRRFWYRDKIKDLKDALREKIQTSFP